MMFVRTIGTYACVYSKCCYYCDYYLLYYYAHSDDYYSEGDYDNDSYDCFYCYS